MANIASRLGKLGGLDKHIVQQHVNLHLNHPHSKETEQKLPDHERTVAALEHAMRRGDKKAAHAHLSHLGDTWSGYNVTPPQGRAWDAELPEDIVSAAHGSIRNRIDYPILNRKKPKPRAKGHCSMDTLYAKARDHNGRSVSVPVGTLYRAKSGRLYVVQKSHEDDDEGVNIDEHLQAVQDAAEHLNASAEHPETPEEHREEHKHHAGNLMVAKGAMGRMFGSHLGAVTGAGAGLLGGSAVLPVGGAIPGAALGGIAGHRVGGALGHAAEEGVRGLFKPKKPKA